MAAVPLLRHMEAVQSRNVGGSNWGPAEDKPLDSLRFDATPRVLLVMKFLPAPEPTVVSRSLYF